MMTRNDRIPKIAAEALNKDVSERTVRRALRRIGLVSEVKKKKPVLSDKNVNARLKFCKDRKSGLLKTGKELFGQMRTKSIDFNRMVRRIIGIDPMRGFKSTKLKKL